MTLAHALITLHLCLHAAIRSAGGPTASRTDLARALDRMSALLVYGPRVIPLLP